MSAEIVKKRLSTENVLPGKNFNITILQFISNLILFQFSDMLLYANRAPGPGLQFRVHGQLSVNDLQVNIGEFSAII